MDQNDAFKACSFAEVCTCGRTFSQLNALSLHQRNCRTGRKRLSGALEKAREVFKSRKKQRLVDLQSVSSSTVPDQAAPVTATAASNTCNEIENELVEPPAAINTDDLSIAARKLHRSHRLPKRFRDVLPQAPPSLSLASATGTNPVASSSSICDAVQQSSSIHAHVAATSSSSSLSLPPISPRGVESGENNRQSCSRFPQLFRTPRNVFGLVRQYLAEKLPSHDPEEHVTLEDLTSTPTDAQNNSRVYLDKSTQLGKSSFGPYPNESSFRLGDWYWNDGVQKSQESFKDLLKIVGDPNFSPADVRDTKWNNINSKLASNELDEDEEWMDEDAGWRKVPIQISVPFHRRLPKPGSRNHIAGELFHRSLISVLREKLTNPHHDAQFHYEPYELLWKPPNLIDEVGVHGELYHSQAFRDAHRALQASPGEPDCDLPRVVAALMFWSDSTHLTAFGTAKLWPCYLYFGNESKYRRCKPTCNLCNHVAYFQALPDEFKDFVTENTGGRGPSKAFMAHCRREFMHEQWKVLLDDEFIQACKHGIVITCCDGIRRRFYPRIFTYSADYPEKVLLASIRNRGACPCPRCLIPMARMDRLGMVQDRKQRTTMKRVDDNQRRQKVDSARSLIYKKNYAVDSKGVEAILQGQSLVPTSNAFSDKLSPTGFDIFPMFVVDLMHEVELGVWKTLFIHLVRVLTAVDKRLVHELDRRFRQIPTFGRDTIRRFSSNVSELKRMAARDFEDILQCAIPVFEGLLPEPHNDVVMRLLFTFAHWHGLAKLRMHTDLTLDVLDNVTTLLGQHLRTFQNTVCSAYDTHELQREVDARCRRQLKKASDPNQETGSGSTTKAPSKKTLNLRTYKYHSLGDYVSTIRAYGTTDSYSTQPGELEHRKPKSRFCRTDRKKYLRQLTQIERRQSRIRRIKEKLAAPIETENVATAPEPHHHIGKSENHPEDIGSFLQMHSHDPATKDFLPKLKCHLLPRMRSILSDIVSPVQDGPSTGTEPVSFGGRTELDCLLFKNNRMYRHNIASFNYTTYDVHRMQDVVNTNTTHRNVMLLANGEGRSRPHPFIYARVLGVYHVNCIYIGSDMIDYHPRRLEFLWVRWYEHVDLPAGWEAFRLDYLRFPPMASEDAFGFIDPADIIRGFHCIPSFAAGKQHIDARGLSRCAGDAEDWRGYYAGRFVDRDMIMRYHWGLGVGHVYTRHDSSCLATVPEQTNLEPEALDSVDIAVDAPDIAECPSHLDGNGLPEFSSRDSGADSGEEVSEGESDGEWKSDEWESDDESDNDQHELDEMDSGFDDMYGDEEYEMDYEN